MFINRKPTGLRETINKSISKKYNKVKEESKGGSFTKHTKKVAYDRGSYYLTIFYLLGQSQIFYMTTQEYLCDIIYHLKYTKNK